MNKIDEIINNVNEKKSHEEEARLADINSFKLSASARFQRGLTLAGLDWIKEYGEVSAHYDAQANDVDVIFTMDERHCEVLKITPVRISACFYRGKKSNYHRSTESNALLDDATQEENKPLAFGFSCRRSVKYSTDWDVAVTIESILVKARDRFNEGWMEDSLKAKEAKIRSNGASAWSFNFWFCQVEGEVVALHKALCEAFPDRSGEFDKELQSWRDQRDAAIKVEEEKKAEIAAREKMERDYFQSYYEFHHKAETIHEANRKVVEAVQAQYTKPVTLFELTYGVVAQTPAEDEFDQPEKYLETRKVVVRTSGDKSGSFLGMDNNPIKYWHPVSARMIEATALEPNGAARDFHGLPSPFDGDGFDLGVWYLVGSADDEEIETALKDAGWQDYPQRPDEKDINFYRARGIRNAVIQGKSELTNDDITD